MNRQYDEGRSTNAPTRRNCARFRTEDGHRVGQNYAKCGLPSLPPAFRQFDAVSSDPGVCEYLSRLTGIADLEFGPDYYGGGIGESPSKGFLPVHEVYLRRYRDSGKPE